jgi:carboxyl-terminal processing protease
VQARVETIDEGDARREADLRNRLENDQSGEEAGVGDAIPGEDEEDYQLDRALDLLRGVAMFGSRTVQ